MLRREFSSLNDVSKEDPGLLDNFQPRQMVAKDGLNLSRRSLFVRQDTFLIGPDDSSSDEDDNDFIDNNDEEDIHGLGRSTISLVERGIRRMLEGADIDGEDRCIREEFSSEVRAYIASHFRMIREENYQLRKSLDENEKQVRELNELRKVGKQQRKELHQAQDEIKKLTGQLERERIKNRSIVKKMKEARGGSVLGESCSSTKSDDSMGDIVWFGLPTRTGPETVSSKNQTSGEESRSIRDSSSLTRPTTAVSTFEDDSPTLGSAPQRRTRSLKNQTIQLKKEVEKLKEILLCEIGSLEGVRSALKGSPANWKGRAQKISELESKLEQYRKPGKEDYNNSSRGVYNSRNSSPDEIGILERDSGDGSSRQDDFSDVSSYMPSTSSGSLSQSQNLREMAIKVHELKTICQVSEVERERLGELVQVLTKKLRVAEDAVRESEAAIRDERKKSAHLQRMVEKLKMEIAMKSPPLSALSSSSSYPSTSEVSELKDRLEMCENHIKSLEQKNDSDTEMYLRMLADTRRTFSQALKMNLENN